MRLIPVVLVLVGSGCAHRFVECRDTASCRAQASERELQFARAVAAEPSAVRLEVEPVSRLVLVDRQRQLVYALDPGLVALELGTGKERWRAVGVSGDSLWRVGRFLAVGTDGARLPAKVTFLNVEGQAVPCSLPLAAPPTAEKAFLQPFDRAGQPYVFWRSDWSYSGGTPPDEAAKAREVSAEACGVVKIVPLTCATSPEPLGNFLWDPPEGRRHAQGEPGFCSELSALRDLPAAAASAPHASPLPGLLFPATEGVSLRVTLREEQGESRCARVSHFALEARDAAASLLWSHPLQERRVNVCGPP